MLVVEAKKKRHHFYQKMRIFVALDPDPIRIEINANLRQKCPYVIIKKSTFDLLVGSFQFCGSRFLILSIPDPTTTTKEKEKIVV